jgi:hypothetical protein
MERTKEDRAALLAAYKGIGRMGGWAAMEEINTTTPGVFW